jgi:hypothetical protein
MTYEAAPDGETDTVEAAVLFQFQIRDALKAVRIEATKAYKQYVEEPKTSQRRGHFDMEMELLRFVGVVSAVSGQSTTLLSPLYPHRFRTNINSIAVTNLIAR